MLYFASLQSKLLGVIVNHSYSISDFFISEVLHALADLGENC